MPKYKIKKEAKGLLVQYKDGNPVDSFDLEKPLSDVEIEKIRKTDPGLVEIEPEKEPKTVKLKE